MKGMYWVWLGALLMGIAIVSITNVASRYEPGSHPVIATQETTAPTIHAVQ